MRTSQRKWNSVDFTKPVTYDIGRKPSRYENE